MTDQELEEIRGRLAARHKGDGYTSCLRCGADEWRINGYCSCECEDLAEREADIASLLAEVERLKGVLREIISECQPVKLDLGNTSIPRIARAAMEGK